MRRQPIVRVGHDAVVPIADRVERIDVNGCGGEMWDVVQQLVMDVKRHGVRVGHG